MKKSNSIIGIISEKDYVALYLFPLGFEILIFNGVEIAFTFFTLELSIRIKANSSLFTDL